MATRCVTNCGHCDGRLPYGMWSHLILRLELLVQCKWMTPQAIPDPQVTVRGASFFKTTVRSLGIILHKNEAVEQRCSNYTRRRHKLHNQERHNQNNQERHNQTPWTKGENYTSTCHKQNKLRYSLAFCAYLISLYWHLVLNGSHKHWRNWHEQGQHHTKSFKFAMGLSPTASTDMLLIMVVHITGRTDWGAEGLGVAAT